MTKDEALKLALEALEDLGYHHHDCPQWPTFIEPAEHPKCTCGYDQAITAIKAVLEAKDEPPRFPTMLRKMWSGTEVQEWVNENWQALPQRKPLTDEERFKMWSETDFRGSGGQYDWFVEGIRAAEAAHGIKGEA